MPSKALVVHSGGQDSTTCLVLAQKAHDEVHTLTIGYGQRHEREIQAADAVCELLGIPQTNQHFISLGKVLKSTSPLVEHSVDVEHYDDPEQMPQGIEPTFVPGRNALFLTLAANVAYANGIDIIYTGVCQEDYGGYPDCRQEFIDEMTKALSLAIHGTPDKLQIITPLMNMTKKETAGLCATYPELNEAMAYTHTCYDGEYPPNPNNHASMLRARGFHEAGIPDPLIVRAKEEGGLPEDYPADGYLPGVADAPTASPEPEDTDEVESE